jgi:lipoprotein NlpI
MTIGLWHSKVIFLFWIFLMFSRINKSLIVCAVIGLTGCQSTADIAPNETTVTNSPFGNLIISEPLPINFKKEIALARISDFLHSEDVKPEQRAKAFYDRGLLYDSFGLPSLARLDFNRALRVNPQMADAYNFVGVHYTLIGQFEKAYEAFDATIELAPKHQYAYLNRGIALYYGGNSKLAVEDFTKFHQFDNTDPYRAIWRYLGEHKIDKTMAIKNLKENRATIDNTVWGRQIVDLYLMNISQAQFIDGLTKNIKSQTQLAERLCEAYFYLGIYARIYNQPDLALNYFKLALATNVFEFVEHRYARRELLETRLQVHKNNQIKHELTMKAK